MLGVQFRMSRQILYFAATALPIFIVWLSNALLYWIHIFPHANPLPFLAVNVLGCAVGSSALVMIPKSRNLAAFAVGLYVPISISVLWIVSFLTACSFGDCI